jgi:hypothetical protein
MAKRAPWWYPPVSYVGIAAAVVLASVIHPFTATPMVPLGVTGQLALLFVMLRALISWPPLRAWLEAMPLPHRLVIGLLVGGMILGHYTFNGRTYFPFVTWEIFPRPEAGDTVRCRQFYGTTSAGARVRLLVEQQFPSIVQVDRVDDIDHAPAVTEALARALARVYNANHPGDPVRTVELVEMAVALHPPPDQARNEPSCELLKSYDISSAPSP